MTQPYYTLAADGTTEVATGTAGPADPGAGTRAKSYAILSGLLGLIPILTVFKVITTDQGAAIGTFTQSAIGLAGAFGFAFVANKTRNQVKNGTFDPPANPVVDAFKAIDAIAAHATDQRSQAVAGAVDAIGAIKNAAALLPGAAGVGSAIGANIVGNLVQELADRNGQL
jgi:hypothetical protein